MNHHQHRQISRRGFLRLAGAGCAACAAAGAAGYALESRDLPPPLPADAAIASQSTGPAVAPLLMLAPSGAYLGELLRAEGLLGLAEAATEQFDAALLRGRTALILGAGPLPAGAADLLRDFVAGGGGLVALRPGPELDTLFGIRHLGAAAAPGAILAGPSHPLAAGIDRGPLQVHAPIDPIALDGAEAVATTAGSGQPAITARRIGQGLAVAWAFDVAWSVALSRQGDPSLVGQERDGMDGLRATDLFQGWADLDRLDVPHADELMRLLSNSLAAASPAPLPRLWYLPAPTNAALVLTGDAHGSYTSAVAQALELAEAHGATMSIYYTPPPLNTARRMLRKARWLVEGVPVLGAAFDGGDGPPAPRDVAAWRERGHEFGMHPYVEGGLEAGYLAHWNDFLKLGYGPMAPSVRTHRILWHGWVDNPIVQARYGIGMNLDHYHTGPVVRRPDGSYASGFLTGSGLPMRFVDEEGRLLSVYQQQTHIVDEQLMDVWGDGQSANLDPAAAAAVSEGLLRRCLDGYPAALGVQCHIDSFSFGGDRAADAVAWLSRLLAAAAAANVPVLSAERWLNFTTRRAAAVGDGLAWDAERGLLTLRLAASPGDPLPLLLPLVHAGRELRGADVAGASAATIEKTVGGGRYALVWAAPGAEIVARYG